MAYNPAALGNPFSPEAMAQTRAATTAAAVPQGQPAQRVQGQQTTLIGGGGQAINQPATSTVNANANAADPLRGTPYEGKNLGDLTEIDPQAFLYGRDPNYAAQAAAAEHAKGVGYEQQFQQGAAIAQDIGQKSMGYGQAQGADLYGRGAGQWDAASAAGAGATGIAADLAGAGGASAAQAQLQSGLNQSEASNIALARSGRGWGQSASALGAAVDQNAAAGQNAANTAAVLRMQQQQAAAGIFGQQSQQAQQAALGLQTAGLGAGEWGYGAGLSGEQAAGQLATQGANLGFAGDAASQAYLDRQHQADTERMQFVMQNKGIDANVQTANNAANAQQLGAIAGAVGTVAGGVIGSFGGPAGTVAGAAAGGAAGNAVGGAVASDVTAKKNVVPVDGQSGTNSDASKRIASLEAKLAELTGSNGKKSANDFYRAPNISGVSGGVNIARAVEAARLRAQAQADAANASGKAPGTGYAPLPQYTGHSVQREAITQGGYGADGTSPSVYGAPQAAPIDTESSDWLDQYMAQQNGGANVTSDEDAKDDVVEPNTFDDTFGSLKGYAYNYIEPDRHGYGRQYGVMAQDLAKTPAGASTLKRSPEDGKLVVDTGKLSMVEAAGLANHSKRISQIESRLNVMVGGKG